MQSAGLAVAAAFGVRQLVGAFARGTGESAASWLALAEENGDKSPHSKRWRDCETAASVPTPGKCDALNRHCIRPLEFGHFGLASRAIATAPANRGAPKAPIIPAQPSGLSNRTGEAKALKARSISIPSITLVEFGPMPWRQQ